MPPPARPGAAMGMMVAAMWIVPFMDVLAKQLGDHYSVLQLSWARFAFFVVLMAPVMLWMHGRAALRLRDPGLQILRSALMLVANILYFAALQHMPIAEALALNFVAPIVVTALSPILLGERVGLARWGAVVAGFIGVLIIIRPGFAAFRPAFVLALEAGVCFAMYMLVSRHLASGAPAVVNLFYSVLFAAIAMTAVLPWIWVTPTLPDLGGMILIGLIAGGSSALVLKAFEMAPVSLLAALVYSEMVMSCVVGYYFFGDLPDALSWLGIVIIVGSGVYMSTAEIRIGRPTAR